MSYLVLEQICSSGKMDRQEPFLITYTPHMCILVCGHGLVLHEYQIRKSSIVVLFEHTTCHTSAHLCFAPDDGVKSDVYWSYIVRSSLYGVL